MSLSFSISPVLPLPWLALAGAVALALSAYAAWRSLPGWWLRALALAFLFVALWDPRLRSEEREPLTNIAIAIVDRSDSQKFGERRAATDKAEAELKRQAQNLQGVDLRVVTVRSGNPETGQGTKLFSALDRALTDIPPERFAGAILITDGQVHDVPQDQMLKNLPGPIHGLITGQRNETDRRIVIDEAPRFGIVGKEQILRVHFEDSAGKEPAAIELRLGSATPQSFTLKPGEPLLLPIPLEHAGDNVAEISVAPRQGEITLENNKALAVIKGVRDRLRVLLVSGEPHPGERTWRNMLKADPAVDLVHFTILRPPDKQDGTPVNELSLIAFPTRELFVDKIKDFDLVIFDRYHREAIIPDEYIEKIVEYVKAGGALLVASGPEFAEFDGLFQTPLAAVLSAQPSGEVLEGPFRPQVTSMGQRHPVTAGLADPANAQPAWGRWFRTIETNAPESDTVMSGLNGKPLLVLSRQGEGRTAQLLSDQSWLWGRGFDGGGPQSELLRRLAHWLMKEPSLDEEALSGRVNGDGLVVERRTMADKAPPITITTPGGKQLSLVPSQISPGLWRASTPLQDHGLYRLSDGKTEAFAVAMPGDPLEMAEVIATEGKLSPVAAATGGRVSWVQDGQPSLTLVRPGRPFNSSHTFGLRTNSAYRVIAVSTFPLSASLLALAILLGLLSATWYHEGR